jgi:hypothetical protein
VLLHADGVMVSHLFPAVYIGVTASSVAAAIVFSTIVLQVETKMASMTMTVAMTNKTRHGAPSTPQSDPYPREGKGKGNEGKDGCRHCRKVPSLPSPSTAATVDNAAIGAIGSIPIPPLLTMTAITAIKDHHRGCHTVNNDNH